MKHFLTGPAKALAASILDKNLSREHSIGILAHEVNRLYCALIGDKPMPTWDDLPKSIQEGMVRGVTIHMEHVDKDPSFFHDEWMKERLADGWTYGAEKDLEKKTHPCLLPYENLPESQRAKDVIFSSSVRLGGMIFKAA